MVVYGVLRSFGCGIVGVIMSGSIWRDAEYVFVTKLHCPYCHSLKPIPIRVEKNGDGSTSRKYTCRVCSRRFVYVVELPGELPKYGKSIDDDC